MAVKITKAVSNGDAVCGLDVSTKTGIVVLDCTGKLILAEEIALDALTKGSGAGPRFHRSLLLGKKVSSLLDKHEVKLVALEGYSHASPFGMALAVELGTSVRFACFSRRVPFIEIAPSTLKKFATGVGKGDKSVVRLGVFKRWAFENASDNVVDAYVLARLARASTLSSASLLAYEREIVGALVKATP